MALQDGLPDLQVLSTTFSGTNTQTTNGLFTSLSGTTVNATAVLYGAGSQTGYHTLAAGSRVGQTLNVKARTAITGGDLLGWSGGEAYALGAFAGNAAARCAGVAVNASPVASGGTVPVLINGVYDIAASAAFVAGDYARQASGTNAIAGFSTAAITDFGRVINDGSSGGTAIVYVNPL